MRFRRDARSRHQRGAGGERPAACSCAASRARSAASKAGGERGRARRVVASAAELLRGSNRNPLRTTPGKARRGSLKNFASRFARVVFHGYRFVIRYQYHRYKISALVAHISAIGIYLYVYIYTWGIGMGIFLATHGFRHWYGIGISRMVQGTQAR